VKITSEQYALIEPYLPRQRGNVRLPNIQVINAILWLAEHDCKWLALPPEFGNWHAVYMRVRRWSKAGVVDRVFEQMQRLGLLRLQLEIVPPEAARDVIEAGTRQPVAHNLSSVLALQFTWVPRIVRNRASASAPVEPGFARDAAQITSDTHLT